VLLFINNKSLYKISEGLLHDLASLIHGIGNICS